MSSQIPSSPTPSPSVAPTSTLAIISLVFGALSWVVLPLIGSITAVITGHLARGEIARSRGALGGDGLAIAGLVLGWLQLIFILAVGFFVILALVFGVGLLAFLGAGG